MSETETAKPRTPRPAPAGTVYPETEWPPLDPDVASDKALLDEWTAAARARYAESVGRRSQGHLAQKLEAERTLRLLFLVRCATQDARELRALWEEARDKLEKLAERPPA